MKISDISAIAGIVGFIISLALAIIKIHESFKERFKLSVSIGSNLSGPDTTRISITNHSKKPVDIDAISLFWTRNVHNSESYRYLDLGVGEDFTLYIPAFRTSMINLEEPYNINIRPKSGALYTELYIAGRSKSVKRKIFGSPE